MKTLTLILTVLTLAMLVLTGCTKDGGMLVDANGAGSTDAQAIQRLVVQTDSLSDFSAEEEAAIDDRMELELGGLSKVATPITPLLWGRKVESRTYTRDVVVTGDTVAVATITATFTGSLYIAAVYNDTSTVPDTVIRKPFNTRVMRKVEFRRVARSANAELNWRPVALTLLEGGTDAGTRSFAISSVELRSGDRRDTLTDPLETWLELDGRSRNRGHGGNGHGNGGGHGNGRNGGDDDNGMPNHDDDFMRLRGGDSLEVRVRVTSSDAAPEHVVLRYRGMGKFRMGLNPRMETFRARMTLVSSTEVGGGWERVYSGKLRLNHGTYMRSHRNDRASAIVDVISHGTLHDDSAPVSNQMWGVPYIVVTR